MPMQSPNKRTYRKRLISIMLAAFALVLLGAGGVVYISFRSISLLMFDWFESLRCMDIVEKIRSLSVGITPSNFVLYNLPDLLWMVSYLLFVNALIPKRNLGSYLFWLLFLPVLAVIHEIMQAIGIIPGSFDYIDLLCYIIPTAINIMAINFSKYNPNLTQYNYEKIL